MSITVQNLLDNFVEQFHKDMKAAKESGAIDTEKFGDVEIGRCVLQITARKFYPLSDPLREVYKNLQHFI